MNDRELAPRSACYWGGQWHSASGQDVITVNNPASGTAIGTVPNFGAAQALSATQSAQAAFPAWRSLPAEERGKFLLQIAAKMREKTAQLARLLTQEQGKPLSESKKEIEYGASYFEWFAAEGRRAYGETIPASGSNRRILVLPEPVGVVAAITPWNFPNGMIARHTAAALAAGCTCICKPAPETPFSALAIAEIIDEIHLPPGVLNFITGDAAEIASAFMQSPVVRKVSFTGSTEVGKLLMQQAAQTVKRLTLELGGNAPFIVCADADLERAARDAMYAKFRNAGQTCICVNRFLVEESVADEFSELLAAQARALHVGNGLDPDTDVGPLVSAAAREKVCSLLSDALDQGAEILLGGMPEGKDLFMYPTIIRGVSSAMRIWREEIFGPICTIRTFQSDDEALQLANDSIHGLAAYLYSMSLPRAWKLMEGLEYGMVGINDTVLSSVQAPFGGIKQSGFGREGGHHGLEEYLNLKYVSLGIAG